MHAGLNKCLRRRKTTFSKRSALQFIYFNLKEAQRGYEPVATYLRVITGASCFRCCRRSPPRLSHLSALSARQSFLCTRAFIL